ncbi:MAG: pyridoxamine 5'-phosphate oxidase family protein [Tannerella sp.]|jgi:uncharacterized pyridoxamine 5'-phosphate oxidase family protein|nr:pyridoxamine 5'-phosphate oxidase family protein [Tannerella sp.]
MYKVFIIMALFCMPFIKTAAGEPVTNRKSEPTMQDVYQFVKKCGFYFIATVDGDQPRVRPFGTVAIYENKLYIQTGKKKNIAKQLKINPKIEICAYDVTGGKWIRIEAKAIADERRQAKQYMLDQYPELKKMYSADDDNTLVLYLKDATAWLNSFSEETIVIKF